MQARKYASEGSTLALKPRADVTRSPKQGYQWPHKKDMRPPKIKKENVRNVNNNEVKIWPPIKIVEQKDRKFSCFL